jgi:sodium-dependent dicarboxylate transporter 2/3/5
LSNLTKKYLGLAIGPVLFFVVLFIKPFDGLSDAAHATLATSLWVAIWWIGELIPIAATSLLPIVLLPLSGAAPINQTTAAYGDKMLFLFIGGFIIAIAMEKWNLHKRIALNIIKTVGSSPSRILLGFMLATGLLSMWISNTATTLMMVTIGSAIIAQTAQRHVPDADRFFKALLLGIAYAASIGGVATLVGTPTNPIFVAIASEMYQTEVSFLQWMTFGFPFALLLIAISWVYLDRFAFKLPKLQLEMNQDIIDEELKKLGKISFEEKAVAWVFGMTAVLWISRSFVLVQWLPSINDTSIAIASAASLFLMPSKKNNKVGLLNWDEAVKLPWGVIILFGGGLSIAAAFRSSGLAEWVGNQLHMLETIPVFFIILLIALLVNFLTEVTSNVATASIMLPVLAALSQVIGIHPFLLMIPATMAASCAFMLPVATAPNAIVFASGNLKVKDMARAGFFLNITSSAIIAMVSYWVLEIVFKF